MVSCDSQISSITRLTSAIAVTASWESAWMRLSMSVIVSVAFDVSWARLFTSAATTENPLPASPARADSMVAFSASRFVWPAIEVIASMTSPVRAADSPSTVMVWDAAATEPTASRATCEAFDVVLAISLIDVRSSSVAAATVETLVDTSRADRSMRLAC